MERQEIEIFLTLAEELHFGRTAERVGVSQMHVSRILRTTLEALRGAVSDEAGESAEGGEKGRSGD